MVFNTVSVGTAVTPTVVETYFSHYLKRKPLHRKPTAHVTYHEGLNIVRQFLHYASSHTIEDLQGFTSQWVPSPGWIRVEDDIIPTKFIDQSADTIITQLGRHGVDHIGGKQWWQWRNEGSMLKADWIEMKSHYTRRKKNGEKPKRIMLYVHGGAYFFGSVDTHRYQLQRHARKLEARLLARMLVTMRDQGIPLPAGAILISPWVDLTHSFPSVAGDSSHDFIPPHGFIFRPSASWPPPNKDDMEQIALHAVEQVVKDGLPRKSTQQEREEAREEAVQGFSVDYDPKDDAVNNPRNPAGTEGAGHRPGNTIPKPGHDLSIMLEDNMVEIKDQIQLYTTNQLISHPLVSPVLQPSLGGLPPLLILTGGGEILRDEQIYLAHKAANPSKYPPGEAYLDEYPNARETISMWRPTDVQLQVWDDLCHVAPTLSFTRPAKYMYRSVAQFGAWALARAQKTEIEIMDDDDVSVISTESRTGSEASMEKPNQAPATTNIGVIHRGTAATQQVGRAGMSLPPFKNHMIRQRVDRHGNIYPLAPISDLPALQVPTNEVGVIKPGPVRKWLEASKSSNMRFAKEKRKAQLQRTKEMAKGYQGFGNDEVPPPSALAGRRGLNMAKEEKQGRSWGMSLWSLWGSSHDEKTMKREEKAEKADREIETVTVTQHDGANAAPVAESGRHRNHSRSKSRRRTVTDTGQTGEGGVDGNTNAAELLRWREAHDTSGENQARPNSRAQSPTFLPIPSDPSRPHDGKKAFPFKLGRKLEDEGVNASTITLTSQAGVLTPKVQAEEQLRD